MQESFLWKSCGALVNNRTSGPVPEGPQFRSDRAKLWSELVVAYPHPWLQLDLATMPIQSCGALVNNRTSGLVLEGPQFNRSYWTLGYGTKLWSELVVSCPIPWPLRRPAHPLMTAAYLEFNKALQDLFQWHWYLLAENCEVSLMKSVPSHDYHHLHAGLAHSGHTHAGNAYSGNANLPVKPADLGLN